MTLTIANPEIVAHDWWPHSSIARQETYGTLTPRYIDSYITDFRAIQALTRTETQFITLLETAAMSLTAYRLLYALLFREAGWTQVDPKPDDLSTTATLAHKDRPKRIFITPRGHLSYGLRPEVATPCERIPWVARIIAQVESPKTTPPLAPQPTLITDLDLDF